jgi:cell wall-associated NlpC family hydrolase
MTMLAAGTAVQQAKKHKKLIIGVLLLPFVLVLLFIAAVVDGNNANAQQGVQGKDCAPAGSSSTSVAGYGPTQMANAAIIVATGKSMNVPEQGWVVAIAAAMQESSLTNLDHGDRDSAGLFQERPSEGWGSHAQVTDPTYASTQFYNHLLAVPNWQSLSVNDAAQAVERSGFPDAYGPHEQAAHEVVGAVDGATCQSGGGGGTPATNPQAQKVINAALAEQGVPYVWGGGTAKGPSGPSGSTSGPQGFDCSGLALYAYAQIGISVPHQTQAIWAAFQPAIKDQADIEPGDLILLSANGAPAGIHHVGIYLGPQNGGSVVEAPETGETVKITDQIWKPGGYWAKQFIGAVRPGVTG